MNKAIIFSALVIASSSSFAAGMRDNIDMSNSVLIAPPTTSDSGDASLAGPFSRSNPDLYGWVVDDQPKANDQRAAVTSKPLSFSRHNSDLFGWVVNDARHG